ncbi:uncharacterized protein LOC128078553 isoform X2 [Tympanuchus pallidicinctus]|uniref:uncharacterized protein LOC128078553 isoform X2 n=1 Tax=Tympanuchus pallidicinctus TaxID=109042 RepID=UPI0022875DC7|nr:uncharacterized protein LOC128078553 isoform X2 [Tympanuchus pallidicinctus]XP_052534844.1 uncharacterized protein LOC128078553 isoform X2 [Tympanuchus pallidicinctus]
MAEMTAFPPVEANIPRLEMPSSTRPEPGSSEAFPGHHPAYEGAEATNPRGKALREVPAAGSARAAAARLAARTNFSSCPGSARPRPEGTRNPAELLPSLAVKAGGGTWHLGAVFTTEPPVWGSATGASFPPPPPPRSLCFPFPALVSCLPEARCLSAPLTLFLRRRRAGRRETRSRIPSRGPDQRQGERPVWEAVCGCPRELAALRGRSPSDRRRNSGLFRNTSSGCGAKSASRALTGCSDTGRSEAYGGRLEGSGIALQSVTEPPVAAQPAESPLISLSLCSVALRWESCSHLLIHEFVLLKFPRFLRSSEFSLATGKKYF